MLQNRNKNWTWNYWKRDTSLATIKSNYPDDLDDTANALLAIRAYRPSVINGTSLAHIANVLISAEEYVGGPYRTWLTMTPDEKWRDVDVVVNANIGALLSRLGVTTTKLEEYIEEQLEKSSLESPYYISAIPAMYFLSHWYPDKHNIVRNMISDLLQNTTHNALMLSMLITAGRNYRLEPAILRLASNDLLRLRTDDHWPAEALYLDPMKSGKQLYAGSAALTTSFAIEALTLLTKNHLAVTTAKVTATSKSNYNKYIAPQHQSVLEDRLAQTILKLRMDDKSGLITKPAHILNKAYNGSVKKQTLRNLNLACIHGWIAYDIYDDFLDEEGSLAQLPLANKAARQMCDYFAQSLPGSIPFRKQVQSVLDTLDAANIWELRNARATKKNGRLVYKLADYKSYRHLAEKSFGILLAPIGVAIISNKPIQPLIKFFTHFLIARQLNDDAHDWEEDLIHGHISAVVSMVLRNTKPNSCVIERDLPELRRYFWQTTIHDISSLIQHHCSQARLLFEDCEFVQTKEIQNLLKPLELAAEEAKNESRKASEFLGTLHDIS